MDHKKTLKRLTHIKRKTREFLNLTKVFFYVKIKFLLFLEHGNVLASQNTPKYLIYKLLHLFYQFQMIWTGIV